MIPWLHMDAPELPPCLRVLSIGCCVVSQHGDTSIKEEASTALLKILQ